MVMALLTGDERFAMVDEVVEEECCSCWLYSRKNFTISSCWGFMKRSVIWDRESKDEVIGLGILICRVNEREGGFSFLSLKKVKCEWWKLNRGSCSG
jgi:hypothetical protein